VTFTGVVQTFGIPLDNCRVATTLDPIPATADGISLGLNPGVHGTTAPSLSSSVYISGTTGAETARLLYAVPSSVIGFDGETAMIIWARMTTLAYPSATIAVATFWDDGHGSVLSLEETTDLEVNSSDWLRYEFLLGATDPAWTIDGSLLDILVTVTIDNTNGINDDSQMELGMIGFRCSIRE